MKRIVVFASVVLAIVALCQAVADDNKVAVPSSAGAEPSPDGTQQGLTMERMDLMQLAFTENQGQWDERVKFRANAGGAMMWFTTDGVYYQFTRRIPSSRGRQTSRSAPTQSAKERADREVCRARSDVGHPNIPYDRLDHEPDSIEQLVIKASFVGANPNVEIVGESMMEYKCNYFIGNDPSKWNTDVPNYTSVLFKEIYPGIDLRYFGAGSGKAGYEFIAAPGADMDQIKVEYEGVDELSVDESGRLIARTRWGDMITAIGSTVDGTASAKSGLLLLSEHTAGFDVAGNETRHSTTLSVTLVYSTYLGGGNNESGRGIAVDSSGCAYVMGSTASSDFPIQVPYQTYQGDYDVFVTKLSSSGNSLIYSTFLGGGNEDRGYSIAVDGSDNAYVTGKTISSDFPTQNPYQTYQGWWDVFVTKLSSSGDSLIYSTFLGGTAGHDIGNGIAVDGVGNAYVTGSTHSPDFPTQNPYQTYQGYLGYADVFVTKLSTSGNSLIYSTYLGGGGSDYGSDIAVDVSGNAYVTGNTGSVHFPTQNPYQMYQGINDVFVTKLSSSGDSLIYSTYLGGGSWDYGDGIAVDGSGNAYVTGSTGSADFPTQNPYQMHQGINDVFVTKLSSSGDSLIYSTYLGGGGSWDYGYGIAVDGSGNAYVTGRTGSVDFPTQNPYQTNQDGDDVFVTKLSSSGNSLIYSTYLGGGDYDRGNGIAVDGSGNAYVTGRTLSPDFPTQNPYQTYQGFDDVFVTKLGAFTVPCGDADGSGEVDIDDAVYLIAYIFSGGPEPVSYEFGDADCSGDVDIDDVVYLIAYIFSGGNSPCDTDGDEVPDC